MNIHFDILRLLGTRQPNFVPESAPPPEIHYYVHFNKKTLEINSVSTSSEESGDEMVLEISEDLGMKFLKGDDNILRYMIIAKKDKFEIFLKTEKPKLISNRVDVAASIYRLGTETDKTAEIWFEIHEDGNLILVSYDEEKISRQMARFYFTRFDDPSHLKFTFTLDVNILNKITIDNGLPRWPNPLTLNVDDASDISIYGIRNQPVACIK